MRLTRALLMMALLFAFAQDGFAQPAPDRTDNPEPAASPGAESPAVLNAVAPSTFEEAKAQLRENQQALRQATERIVALTAERPPASVGQRLESSLHFYESCNGGARTTDLKGTLYSITQKCDWVVGFSPTETEGTFSFYPKQLVLTRVSDGKQVFTKTIAQVHLATREVSIGWTEWFDSSEIGVGQTFSLTIQYTSKQGDANEEPFAALPILQVKWTRSLGVWQVTPKVFTAWRTKSGGSDQSYLVPGLAFGYGLRLGDRADDTNVIAFRGVAGVGPNLAADATLVQNDEGQTQVQQDQKIRGLVGLEVTFSKYISLGAMWVVLGKAETEKAGPLLLISYGELYEAPISSK